MTISAIALILLSAVLHALWNFFLKRCGGGQDVVALSKIAEAIVFAPIFLVGVVASLPAMPVTATLVLIAAAGVLANYSALATAYRHGDLSFVYPTARGGILVFLPVAGYLVFGERVSAVGLGGLATIVTGILVLNLDRLSLPAVRRLGGALASRATTYALVTAFLTATYTIWDKYAVRQMQPFAYMYLYTLVVAVCFGGWLFATTPRPAIVATWKGAWPSIVAIGVLNTISYLLVLAALRDGISSYVLGLRQLSIVFGVLLGWLLLREPMGPPRATGVALILGGCLMLSVASQH